MSGKRVQRRGTARSVTVGVALLALVLVAPVEANWLARGSGVLGVGYSLKRNLGEGIDLMGEALDAAMHGDAERMREISEEIEALPGRLIRDAFPVFKLGAAVRDATAAAGERLKSAAGRIPRLRSETLGAMASSRKRLRSVPLKVRRYYGDAGEGGADPRMALAIDEEERALFAADVTIPGEEVLAAVPASTATGDGAAEAGASAASGWDEVAGSDPWAADEGESRSSGWDEEPASGGMQVAGAKVEATSGEEVVDDDGDDYTDALNALLSDDAASDRSALAHGTPVVGGADEAAKAATPNTTESVEQIFDPKCDTIFGGHDIDRYKLEELADNFDVCYIEFINIPGCHLALNKRENYEGHTVEGGFGARPVTYFRVWDWTDTKGKLRLHWSGGCSGGVPDGQGTLSQETPLDFLSHWGTVRMGEEKVYRSHKYTGRLVDGVPQGNWTWNSRFVRDKHSIPAVEVWEREAKYTMMNGQMHGGMVVVSGYSGTGGYYGTDVRGWCDVWTGKVKNGRLHQESLHKDRSPC